VVPTKEGERAHINAKLLTIASMISWLSKHSMVIAMFILLLVGARSCVRILLLGVGVVE
jgi:hypothetical protein